MENVLLDDRAVQIVRAVTERDLRELEAEADPVGRDVIEVIEVDAADGDGAQRIKTRRRMLHGDAVVLRLIRQRNEAREAVRLVLQHAQLPQMIHAVRHRLDMAVKHRAGAAPAEAMPGAMHVEVFRRRFLAARDGLAHFGTEDFRAAPVSESSPAALSSVSVSTTDFFASHARCKISMAVKHFNCSCASSALSARSMSV